MTLRQRVVEVLELWCGDEVVRTDEKLEDLWNRTKPTGTPSHNGLDYFPPGATDLVDRVTSEYERPRPELRRIDFDGTDLNPAGGTILTIDDLFIAVGQSPIVTPEPMDAETAPAKMAASVAGKARTTARKAGKNKRGRKSGK